MTIECRRQIVRWSLVCALAIGLTGTAVAGPTVTVGKTVPANQRIAAEQINHASWNALLQKYVDARGMVNYAAWKAAPADVAALDAYLNHLSAARFAPATDVKTRVAFWSNAYNAVTIHGILREYPTTSIRNHTARLFGYNIWKDLKLVVEGRSYSLEDIEHEVLRKLGEPRIHFAIVCASIGCPLLLNEAFDPRRLDEQLTTNTRAFFADPTKFRYDAQRRAIMLSPILDWFAGDFGSNQAEQLAWIAPYLPDAAAQEFARGGQASVSYLDYDWGINEQRTTGSGRRN